MAHRVPDFEMDPSSPTVANKTLIGDDEIMELLWENGQVVAHTQNQNHRSLKKPAKDIGAGDAELPPPPQQEIPSVDAETLSRQRNQNQNQNQNIFTQEEDEMASWLLEDYSLDREIYSDIIYSPIPSPTSSPPPPPHDVRRQHLIPPPVPPGPSSSTAAPPPISSDDIEIPAVNFQNILNFSRVDRARVESSPSSSSKAVRELTNAVSINETQTAVQNSRFSLTIGSSPQTSNGNDLETSAVSTSTAGRGFTSKLDLTVTASPDGSGASVDASVEATPAINKPPLTAEEKKRKVREPDIDEEQEDDFGSIEVKKISNKCTLVKRSRASEIHNLSERRRRDRINEKMRILQELIPRCNKVDKASMLDEAIEYLKSLQMQVQMMSMGCSMVPVIYNGAQQYMPAMGMGMGMGINHPMMTYPAQFTGSGFPQLQTAAAAANLAPRFPMPTYPLQQNPVPDTTRNPTLIQPYPMLHSLTAQGSNPVVNPYQHLVGFQQAQVPVQIGVHSQVGVHHINKKPSSNKDAGKPENEKIGLEGRK